MNTFPNGFFGHRLALVADAARLLRDAINSRPELDGTDVVSEYDTLRNEPTVFGYLDDLEARCGVNVTDARALLRLAYLAAEDEFIDHYWTLQSRGYITE